MRVCSVPGWVIYTVCVDIVGKTALPVHLKDSKEGTGGGKGQNLSSTLSKQPELCFFTLFPAPPPSPCPLWKVSLGSLLCPHKKQKSADAA